MKFLARRCLPDPEALAAGLVAEPAGKGWRYHDPQLRAHLAARRPVGGHALAGVGEHDPDHLGAVDAAVGISERRIRTAAGQAIARGAQDVLDFSEASA